ncbi:hypothetical protein V1264_009967 [Littorina saxatilis]
MACCLPSRDQSNRTDYILDVEEILKEFVWNTFKDTRPPWQQLCLRRRDFVVDVPMNYFHFDKLREEVRQRQKPDNPTVPQPHPSLASHMTHMPRDVMQNALTCNSNVMALSTDFTNCTDVAQTYKFRFEKTRKASLGVTFQRGFSIGGKVDFSLGLPKLTADGKVGGEVDMRLTVSKSTGEIIEETLTWEATSEINVAKTSNYTAKVLLSEAPVSYNFKMWTKMSMPTGAAPATIRRKNNDSFRYTHLIENLKEVFDKNKNSVDFVKEALGGNTVYAVVFKTTGIVDGVRLSDQKILLEGHDLSQRTPTSYGGSGGVGGGGSSGAGANFGHFRNTHGVGDVTGPQELMSSDVCQGDGYIASHPPSRGRMLGLGPSHPPPSPIPMIEEMPEEDGGVGECEREGVDYQAFPPPAPIRAGSVPIGGGLPRITTTPSSQASSPLSEAGSQDISECSKKSETVTTV